MMARRWKFETLGKIRESENLGTYNLGDAQKNAMSQNPRFHSTNGIIQSRAKHNYRFLKSILFDIKVNICRKTPNKTNGIIQSRAKHNYRFLKSILFDIKLK